MTRRRPAFDPTSPWISGARLFGVTASIAVERERLSRWLAEFGSLALQPNATNSASHPLVIEFWRLEQGRLEVAGMDQHQLAALTLGPFAAFSGAVAGAWAGAGQAAREGVRWGKRSAGAGERAQRVGEAWGWLAGASAGAAWGSMAGLTSGGRMARDLIGAISQAGSELLGKYHELMLSVPGVVAPTARVGGSGKEGRGPFNLVVRMYTDSPFAQRADRLGGYGYDKQLRSFERSSPEHWAVLDTSGQVGLELRTRTPALGPRLRAASEGGLAAWRTQLERPLLGRNERGAWAISRLQRDYDDSDFTATPVSGDLHVRRQMLPFLGSGRYELEPLSRRRELGAFEFGHLMTRVNRPTALGG